MGTEEKAITKTNNNAIGEVLSREDKKDLAEFNIALLSGTPRSVELTNKVYNEILPKFHRKLTEENRTKCLVKTMYRFGLDTHAPLWESVSERYGLLAVEFARQLFEEYDCQTASEKALAQLAVNAYVRTLECSSILKSCMKGTIAAEITGYYSMLSKELDRANRQFITAITTLKQMKVPQLKVNVKAKNAFVAQNQQINQNKENENI